MSRVITLIFKIFGKYLFSALGARKEIGLFCALNRAIRRVEKEWQRTQMFYNRSFAIIAPFFKKVVYELY